MPRRQSIQEVKGGKGAEDAPSPDVKIEYRRSTLYRTIFAHGFLAGWNGQGQLHIIAWNEHPSYPLSSSWGSTPETFGIEKFQFGETVVDREIEIGITMRPEIISDLIDLLQKQLSFMRGPQGATGNEPAAGPAE